MLQCMAAAAQLGFANPAIFSKPVFSGLESSKPRFLVRVCQWPMDGLRAVKPIMSVSPDRRPLACLFIVANCVSCVRASSSACTTVHQQLETEHQIMTENVRKHHQLIASCTQKRTESQSFQYHIHIVINHHWLLIWQNYNSLSLNLQEKAWACFLCKISS